MNILFDLIATQPERDLKYHGGSEYAKAVFKAIVGYTQSGLFCIYDSDRFLDKEIRTCCVEKKFPLLDIREVKTLDSAIEKYSIERFYTALPLDKVIQQALPVSNGVKSIITIHGLRSLELLSDTFELKYRTGFKTKLKYIYKRFFPPKYEAGLLLKIKQMIRNYNNPAIITVSDYSKQSLKYFIPEISDQDIHVLYSPINDYIHKTGDNNILLANRLESKKYFLILSASIWQKNSYRMLLAFLCLLKKDLVKGYKFVVVGASRPIKEAFPQDSFIYLDYLDRPELEILLQYANALVYPSLNEGFGYPPLEAFKYGTGVIASAISPVIEICGNAALFFNPYSFTEMKLKLLQSINDPAFVSNTKPRLDQYLLIRQKQMNDLDSLVRLICT